MTRPSLIPGITLLGLGPGSPELMTRQAWKVLNASSEVILRTSQHPAVAGFPPHLKVHSFDYLYEAADQFEAVYQQIVETVLELGRRPEGVVYAVPGHPFVAESTAPEIAQRAKTAGIPVRVVAGLSFLEPVFTLLEIDPFPQLTILDAFEISTAHHPSFPPDIPVVIGQLHSRLMAADVKLALMAVYPDAHPVKLVHAAGTPDQLVEEIPLYQIDHSQHIGLLTSLFLPPLESRSSFESFQEIIAHLRAPDGCPWDRKQTHQSLRPHLLEETYEVLSAIDAGDPEAMKEELGDLLLQIVLHAQIGYEMGEFTMGEVLNAISTKLIHRHPHVFGDLQLDEVDAVLNNWERLKASERLANGEEGKSLLDGVSQILPALAQSSAYQKRAANVGFDWDRVEGVFEKILEELEEVRGATEVRSREAELGDLLFAVVRLADWLEVDPESALREANQRFRQRFAFIEKTAAQKGETLSDLSPDEMNELWEAAKKWESTSR